MTWQGTVAMFRRLAGRRARARLGLWALQGMRLHERALRAGLKLEGVAAAESLWRVPNARWQALLAELEAAGCPVWPAPDEAVAAAVAGRTASLVVGVARRPPPATLATVLAETGDRALLLTGVDISAAGNVGALTRTAHALGATALLAVGVSDPFHPTALRTSMGSVFKLPVATFDTAETWLEELTAAGVQTIGLAAQGGEPLPRFIPPAAPLALCLGNEAQGLDPALAARLDYRVTIPMQAGVDSYSVNVAAALALYELQRRRWL